MSFEQTNGAVRLAVCGTAREQYLWQALDLDGAVDRQIGPRALRQWAREVDVHLYRALLDGGVDAYDLSGHDAVARVDAHRLTNLNVARLGLRDVDLGAQIVGSRDARDVLTECQGLTVFREHLLQHAGHTGAHFEPVDLLLLALVGVTHLRHVRLACRDLRLDGVGELCNPIRFDLEAYLELLGHELGSLHLQRGYDVARRPLGFGLSRSDS